MSHLLPLLVIMILFIIVLTSQASAADFPFACGGKVENEAWELWDSNVKNFLKEKQLQNRLLKQGDVYALYDFQTYTHNLVGMARRCNRVERLQEIARMIDIAYSKLEPAATGRQWVCRGGSICNDRNRLLNKEVQLDSLQFLGLASSVANALVAAETQLTNADKVFVENTAQILIEHLLRWSDKASIASIDRAKKATPQDVKNGSSALFFTDKPLWMIHIYAELSSILVFSKALDIPQIPLAEKKQLTNHINELMQFFTARLSIRHKEKSRLGDAVTLADIDRGYWKLYADNTYAGYEKAGKPVMCIYSGNNKSKFKINVVVPADRVLKLQNTSWDISHARRLVHALDALERNRSNLSKTFNLKDNQLPPADSAPAFANALVSVVWNGDKAAPLFTNYWSGANGWYRVAYDNGTGLCREGYPPFGLTDSIPTGGYFVWAKYNPTVGVLGKQLYSLMNSAKASDTLFVTKYYPSLSHSASVQNRALSKIMFLPSLVGVSIK